MIQTLMEWKELIVTVLSALIIIFRLIASNAKNAKLRKAAEMLNFVAEKARELVEQAEKIVNFRGADKKEWVLTKINQACIDAGIPFDKELASRAIEAAVELTKTVNARDKDKKLTLEVLE